MYCTRCGAPAPEDASFCARCGARLRGAAPEPAAAMPAAAMPAAAMPAASMPAATMPAAAMPAAAMPAASMPAAALTVAVRYGGFWRRFASGFVDGVLFWLLGAIVNVSMGVSIVAPDWTEPNAQIALLLQAAAFWLYCALLESSAKQGTLGQQLLDLKVTDLQGHRISIGRATGRHFAQFISALLLGIGYLMIAFTKQKQGLHDMMAGCLVVRRDLAGGAQPVPAVPS